MNAGILYVVATPIGNMDDISSRAVEILRSCDIVACEDTRVSGLLLKRFGIEKDLFVYENSREQAMAPVLLEKIKSGKTVALISDAGTPCISDPGFRIVKACRAEKIHIVPIPGPCAFVSALSASGLPSDSFLFVGFLPAKGAARRNFFNRHKDFPHTIVFYESPYRIVKFIADAIEIFGPERPVCVAKEISKIYERFFTGKLLDVSNELLKTSTKGEFVVLIAPASFCHTEK